MLPRTTVHVADELAADLASSGDPMALRTAQALLGRKPGTRTYGGVMAGRPRTRARNAGLPAPAHLGEPQGAGTWQQFVPGNQVAVGNPAHLAHGTRSLSRTDQVADVIIADLLDMPTLPEFMKDPTYKYALRGWARAEARVVMYVTWMDRLSDDEQNNASGAQQAPVLKAAMLEDAALRHRGKLGLDPVSRVKIGKSLSSRGLDLAKMAAMEYGGEDDDGEFDG